MGHFKTVAASQVTITELMTPEKANFGGKIHGGHILSLLDKVAYVCAAKHANGYCVTISVDTVDFLHPIEVGELVHFHASVNYTGKTSMVVGVKVVAENVHLQSVRHTNTSYLTMVAVDEQGKPREVDGLKLTSATEVRRFYEAKARKDINKAFRSEFSNTRQKLNLDLQVATLQTENCLLELQS
ncbi:MAG TPA: acyl-CoA thioesterase [Luteibaculaceae bacterium]|nr:acyl-CoA thioesterase [Luteibaculaceae bacterium]